MKKEYKQPTLNTLSVSPQAVMALVTSGTAPLGDDKTVEDPEAIQAKWTADAWDE